MAVVGSIVVGGLTANYLGEAASHYIGTSVGASSFVMGLCGMAVCQGLFESVKKWRPVPPGGGGDAH
jgi:hypothetical protein